MQEAPALWDVPVFGTFVLLAVLWLGMWAWIKLPWATRSHIAEWSIAIIGTMVTLISLYGALR